MSDGQRILRECAICGAPVPVRQYQANSARTCKPICAKTLAVKEHPDIDKVGARDSGMQIGEGGHE